MKHVLLMVVLFVAFSITSVKAQVLDEDFEGTTFDMTSSSSGTDAWTINTRLFNNGAQSDSVSVTSGDTTYLTSMAFSTAGKYAVYFDFAHICKVAYLDDAYLEVSNDDGLTWLRVEGIHRIINPTSGLFINNKFSELSYPAWGAAALVSPDQTWWRNESFDLSTLIPDAPLAKVRFVIIDKNNISDGIGWFVDDVIVNAEVSEQIPPSITLLVPIAQDTVLTSGSIGVSASISDASGIDTAICVIHVMPEDFMDTVGMLYDPSTVDTFNCEIPFYGFGRTTNYYVKAWDSSASMNNDSTATYHYIAKNAPVGEVIIGTGTDVNSSYSYPAVFGQYYSAAKEQYLILASELTALGVSEGPITSLGFDVVTINGPTAQGSNHDNFTIKIKNTSVSALNTNFETGLSQVFTTPSYQTITGWNNFTFSSPFSWDGNSNIIVEVCFDNYVSSSNYSQSTITNRTTTSFNSANFFRADDSGVCSNSTGTVGVIRPNINFNFLISSDLVNDMGVASILNPTTGVLINSNYDIQVDLANYGVDTITTAQINWSFDGVPQTAYTFGTPADSLFPGELSDTITLGTKVGTAGTHYIAAWSTMPNGIPDADLINDTAKFSFYGCVSLLAGDYTIGSGPTDDFPTFSDAALALNQCGISAPVVFNVNEGVYNEQIVINDITGSSATNTITFQSTSLDSSTTTLSFDAQGINDNYVVKLNGTNNIIFKNLSFVASNATYGRVFELTNLAHNLAFTNNIISALPSTQDDDNMILIFAADTIGNNINISNNALLNATQAIRLQGGFINATNWNVSNNMISGHYIRGIELDGSSSAIISHNQIYSDTTSQVEGYYGIALSNSSGSPMVTKNMISTSKTKIATAIAINTSVFDTINLALIANNVSILSVNSTTTTISAGVINYGSSNVNIYNNSIHFKGIHPSSANVVLFDISTTSSMNINIANNSITNDAEGYLFYVNIDTNLWTVNNNNLFSYGGNKFTYVNAAANDFASWMTESGAVNSTNIDPYLNISTGIQINNNLLNNTGIALASVTDDINGVARDANTPDISAYEFEAQPWDILTTEILSPMSNCGLTSTESVTVRYTNIGTSDITTFTAYYQLNGNTIVDEPATPSTPFTNGSTFDYTFTTTVDLDVNTYGSDSVFAIKAWADLTGDLVQLNDTISTTVNSGFIPANVYVPNDTILYNHTSTLTATGNNIYWWASETDTTAILVDFVFTTPNLYDTTTYWVNDGPNNELKLTETVQYKTGTGATSPYPSYITAPDFDGIEISNLGAKVDIAGYTVYVATTTTTYSYTFPTNSILESGNVAVVIYNSSLSTPGPQGNNVFVIYPGPSPSSGTAITYWLTNNSGDVIDAFSANSGSFPSASGVTAADFSGSLGGGSGNAGAVRILSDNNADTDWNVSGSTTASFGSLNSQIPVTSTGGCFGERQPVTVIVEDIPSIDASASQIITPIGTVPADVDQAMTVVVTNFGTATLTTLDLNYRINNGASTTYAWTGSIAYQQTDTISIGNVNFEAGIHDLYAWTSNPNGVNDTINSNDTTTTEIKACLNGTYTIGDTTGGIVYDFPSFNSAIDVLNAVGVCAPVIFTVDSGIYNERITIEEIDGASATNTVTFTGLQGDSSLVTMQATNTYSLNHIVKFDGADYVTFSHLGFKALTTGSYGKIFVIAGGSDYITIKNNKLESAVGTGSYDYAINGENSIDNYTTIMNNHIINSSRAVNLFGNSSSNREMGHVITNNFMDDFSESAVYIQYADSITISNNRIETESIGTSTFTTHSVIYTYYCSDNITINANTIYAEASGETIGINIFNNQSTTAESTIVSNNTIKITDGTDDNVGIKVASSTNIDFVYNTISITSSSSNVAAAKLSTSTSANITFVNNIVSSTLGYAIELIGDGISTIDNNAYYTTNAIFAKYAGTSVADLAALQAASSMDANSAVVEAEFVSDTDLHLANSLLAGLATPVTYMTVDMDGDARSITRPTIGADEKEMAQFDIGVLNIINLTDIINENVISTPIVIIKNYGYDTLTAFDISYTVNNGTATVYNYTSVLAPAAVDTVTLADFSAPAGPSQFCATTILATDTSTYNDTRCHDFYGFPQKDALLIDITSIEETCNMTTASVTVQLTNIGIDTINGYNQNPTTMSYQSNNNTVITEPYTIVVPPMDTVWYTFTTPVYVGTNNIVDSNYRINAWVNFDNDSYTDNDSIATNVYSMHSPPVPTFTNPLSVVYATQATLNANSPSNDTIIWFYDNTLTSLTGQGNSYTTDWYVIQDTSMYVASRGTFADYEATFGTESILNTTTGFPSTFANYYWGNKEQYLILASELVQMNIAPGPITKVAFDVEAVNACPTLENYKVSIGASSKAAMTEWEIGLTPVYNNNAYITVEGWNEINFATPFVWDGVSNIIIEICSNNSSYISNGNAFIKSSNTPYVSTLNMHDDESGVCAMNTTSSFYSKRPNMKITGLGAGCYSDLVEYDIIPQAQSACDVAVISSVDLIDRVYLTSNENITIEVVNFGSSDQATIPVHYTLNGGTAFNESVSINANDTVEYTFSAQADMSTEGDYNFKFYTDLACDNLATNDSLMHSMSHLSPEYCESTADYNSYTDISRITIDNDSNISLSPYNKKYTDFTGIGALTTVSPTATHQLQIGIASEYTGTWSKDSGFVKVYIDYNRDGIYDPIDEYVFGSKFNDVVNNDTIITGSFTVDADANIGTAQMRVVCVRNGVDSTVTPCGTYQYGETEDYVVNIAPIIAQDAGVEQILNIDPLTDLASIPLVVRVRNYGFDPITSVDIVYEVTGIPSPTTYVYSTVIPVGDSADVTVGMIPVDNGQNHICVKTILAGDDNYFNDEKCLSTFKQAFETLSYEDDYESTDLWMVGETSTQWERGEPTMSNINTAHSPVNVWAIGLDTNYDNNSMEYLYSPKFNTVGVDSAKMSFWHFYQTEMKTNSADGGYIQFRINSDVWLPLGYMNDSRANNWYTKAFGGSHLFSGNSNGWIESTYNLDFTSTEFANCDTLQLRYVFYSNASSNDSNGWAIDDFKLLLPPMAKNIGVTAIASPTLTVQNGEPMTITVDVENFGTADQSTFNIWYQIGSDAPVSQPFSPAGGLIAGTTQSFTFTTTPNALSTDFIVCAGTDLVGDENPGDDDDCGDLITVTAAAIDGGVTAVGKIQNYGGDGETSVLSPVVVKAEITNFGINTLTSFDIEFSINGSDWFTETWTGSLATNAVDTFVFTDTTYASPFGNYQLCVRTDITNDADTDNDKMCKSYIGTSINDADGIIFEVAQNEPNPAVGNVRINYVVPTNGNINFELRNTLGQMIYSVEQSSFTGNNTIEVDANNLANGVYYYSVVFDGQRITRKMIVNK